jgi:tRNA (guanine37-N1)-methyltransferase
MLQLGVITLFPQLITPYWNHGIITRALEDKLSIKVFDMRAYTPYTHGQVDDRPFGGGPGMVLMPQVLFNAVQAAREEIPNARVIALSPVGKPIKQIMFTDVVNQQQSLIFVCGRYEGFDQRFIDQCTDESWSLGDFILTGGELGALVCIDALARLLPGVLNEPQSLVSESFSQEGLLDYPHYTRPRVFNNQEVPDVLLSGNHAQIEQWRQEQARLLTQKWRPDLLVSRKDGQNS